jgi:signal peptidase I
MIHSVGKMEIPAVPRRQPALGRGWLVAAAAVLVALGLFLAIPLLLGLHRDVVSTTALEGRVDRGTLLFSATTAVSDLQVGDVIMFEPPAPFDRGSTVTREVLRMDVLGVLTSSDAGIDPWELPTSGVSVDKAVGHIDYVGYPFLALAQPFVWLLFLGVPALLLVIVLLPGARHGRREVRRAGPGTTDLVDE